MEHSTTRRPKKNGPDTVSDEDTSFCPTCFDDPLSKLDSLNKIGTTLSSEHNADKMIRTIVRAAKSLICADCGLLYLVDDDKQSLCFRIIEADSLHISYDSSKKAKSLIKERFNLKDIPNIPLYGADGKPNDKLVAAYAAVNQRIVNINDVYDEPGFDFSGTRRLDEWIGYRSRSFLTVPMKDHRGKIIGVLQLVNAIDPHSGATRSFDKNDQHLAESLASQAAIKLTNHALIEELKNLFEAFIHMINITIDDKSPHTGEHCQRVPELTMMLANAVEKQHDGAFADFHLSKDDFYELKIAALLHDCGKITTPSHVVDKATKLQTVFDRIELIETRFEVLRRDARIAALEARLAGEKPAQIDATLEAGLAQLDADEAFLHQANIGRESMPEADRQRILEIAERQTWQDRHGRQHATLTDDEIENLRIKSGTLTAAERDIINYHIVSTIKMLSALPWPDHLKRITEYAGGHHERMDGKGYPNGLTREQLSVPARIIGIADIFEALTAPDRPYKDGMKLSQALTILERYSKDGHIDPDLFEVFMKTKVYLRYGKKFLSPRQIDVS